MKNLIGDLWWTLCGGGHLLCRSSVIVIAIVIVVIVAIISDTHIVTLCVAGSALTCTGRKVLFLIGA